MQNHYKDERSTLSIKINLIFLLATTQLVKTVAFCNLHSVFFNRPFPSSLVPLFQSKSKCKTILMKMTLICMKMKLYAELIFI